MQTITTRKTAGAALAGTLLAASVLSGGMASALGSTASSATGSSGETAGDSGSGLAPEKAAGDEKDSDEESGDDKSEQASDQECSVDTLDVPEGTTESQVTAGSPDGSQLVGYVTVDGEKQPAMWGEGTFREVFADLSDPSVTGINDEGVVTGFGFKQDETVRTSFIYLDGETRELAPPEGGDATVTGINGEGDTAGYGENDDSALRWVFDSHDEVEKLDSPLGGEAAHAIDEDGTAGGYAGSVDEETHAALWSADGSYEELPALDGATHSAVESIRGDFAAGYSTASMEDATQALWNLEDETVTQLPESMETAHDVNDSGVVAASTEDDHAALVRDGEVTTLPHAGGEASTAYTVSDSGDAAGTSQDAEGNDQAVVWSGC